MKEAVIQVIEKAIGSRLEATDFSKDLADLGIDSMNKINIVLDLESITGKTIPEDNISPENFRTTDAMIQLFEGI